mmetsp:Transcript_1572/g.4634  ORF Transcript_1572/g.4634 Transcript_1572/m.4634 type:complete len:209 (-) Transcript_1572:270-896(-)
MPAAVRDIASTVSSSPKACEKIVGSANPKHDTSSMVTLTRALFTMNTCSFSATKWTPLGSSLTLSNKGCRAPICDSVKETSMGVRKPLAALPPPSSMMPPKKNDIPNTSSILDSTEPSKVALTTFTRPARRVCTVMIISTAFPKVALSKPLMTSLCKQASSSSVASPRILASGISAKKFSQKTQFGSHPNREAVTPRGSASKNTLNGW